MQWSRARRAGRHSGIDPSSSGRGRGRGHHHRERSSLRRALVVAQVALSLILLVGALLFVQSLRNLLTLDAGFRSDGLLVADVDFTRAIPIEFIARKSLAANLSDLAAMGATPTVAVIALGAPPNLDIEKFMIAMADAAKSYSIEIVGGDVSRSDKIIVSIAALGIAKRPLPRPE